MIKLNNFLITHSYSFPELERCLQSPMSFIEMWNHIKILQNITWDIDSSHGLYEDDTVFLMSKFFGAKLIDPTSKDIIEELKEDGYYEIDLYGNWESGYANDRGGRSIPRDQTDAMMEKYNFYKQGLYSAMLSKFLEQHNFGEGETCVYESVLMNNKIWNVLFQEGVYDRDKFMAEQKARPEFMIKYDSELHRLAEKAKERD